jgi:hypothetical protein
MANNASTGSRVLCALLAVRLMFGFYALASAVAFGPALHPVRGNGLFEPPKYSAAPFSVSPAEALCYGRLVLVRTVSWHLVQSSHHPATPISFG